MPRFITVGCVTDFRKRGLLVGGGAGGGGGGIVGVRFI